MPATLRHLIAHAEFDLTATHPVLDHVLDEPITSAHSSDLPDPTPWLDAGCFLLTDGLQFLAPRSAEPLEYVTRLAAHGVIALGFATGVMHDRIPLDLERACDEVGMPLIEVSRCTPFMGIIRAVADAVASDSVEDLRRSLQAQRSIARAALKPDGLVAILRALELELGGWVALFDPTGRRLATTSTVDLPASVEQQVRAEVLRLLARGRTAALKIDIQGEQQVTLQTVGHNARIRGVLAVSPRTRQSERASVGLIEAVIALASVALEQNDTLDEARRQVRASVIALLVSGATDAAAQAAHPLWGPLPEGPVLLGVLKAVDEPEHSERTGLLAALDAWSSRRPGSLFFGENDSQVLIFTLAEHRETVANIVARRGYSVGFSSPHPLGSTRLARREAERAAERTTAARRLMMFDDIASAGLLGHLEKTGAQAVAHHTLEPIASDDETKHLLRVWLEHNGSWEVAARALRIHRHTLRNRINAAAQILGSDLDSFAGRAEIWASLKLLDGDTHLYDPGEETGLAR